MNTSYTPFQMFNIGSEGGRDTRTETPITFH